MITRILNKIFTANFIAFILMVSALQTFTYGISSSLNSDTNQSAYFFWICALAVLISVELSKRKFNGIQAAAGMAALGMIGVWILGARLASPLLGLGNGILQLLPHVGSALRYDIPIDATAIAETWSVIADSSSALGQRIQAWSISVSRRVNANDPLVRNMVWTLVMWLNAACMGWFAQRRKAVPSLTPSILLLAAVISYSEFRIGTLWGLVVILLLLLGIWNYTNHTTQWETRKVDYSDSIRYDAAQAVLLFTIIVGVVTLITPSLSWRDLQDFLRKWNQPSENQVANVLGVQQQHGLGPWSSTQKPSLPRDHLISTGVKLSDDIVMTVRTGELPPAVIPSNAPIPPRYYWRSTVFDKYVGAGWITSVAPSHSYPANTPLIPGLLNGYRILHLNVEMMQPEGKLFWSGVLFSADIPLTASWRTKPQASLFADQSALLQADMFSTLTEAKSYRVDAYVPQVTISELRSASTDYPKAITDRYLQLPYSLPERVRVLAKEITSGKVTPYDKVKAIEAYLRTYPYELTVTAPSEGQDVADYFLFDLKKGYCDYYATGMVVLARASGVPARFVSGYASGVYDNANAVYIVQELHAHSWVEVYFPEIGWIEFEPTASLPEIELSDMDPLLPTVEQPDPTATQLINRLRLNMTIYLLSPFAFILFAAIIYFTLIERWWYLRFAPATAIEKIYRRLYNAGRPLAGERTRAETAYEFMQKLVTRIEKLAERSRFVKLFIRAQQDVGLLTDLYQSALFSRGNIQKSHARKALSTWKHLRLRLLIARVIDIANRVMYRAR